MTSDISSTPPSITKKQNVQLLIEQRFHFFREILSEIRRSKCSWAFVSPIDIVSLGISDYPKFITHPMDFGTIQEKLENGEYGNDTQRCLTDFILVFDDCYHYYGPVAQMSNMAFTLQKLFVKRLVESKLFTEDEIMTAKNPVPDKYMKIASGQTPYTVLRKKFGPGGAQVETQVAALGKKNAKKPPKPLVFPQESLTFQGAGVVLPYSGGNRRMIGGKTISNREDVSRIQPNYDELFQRFPGDTIPLTQPELATLSAILRELPRQHVQRLFDLLLIAAPDKAGDMFTRFMRCAEKRRFGLSSQSSSTTSSSTPSPSSATTTTSSSSSSSSSLDPPPPFSLEQDNPRIDLTTLYKIDPFSVVEFDFTSLHPIVQRNFYKYAVDCITTICQQLSREMPLEIPPPPVDPSSPNPIKEEENNGTLEQDDTDNLSSMSGDEVIDGKPVKAS